METISNNVRTARVLNALAGGYTDAFGTILDRSGFGTIRLVVLFGAISATPIIRVRMLEGNAADMSDATLVGSSVTIEDGSADNKVVILEQLRPAKRYVRLHIQEVSGTAAIDGAIAELGGARSVATSDDASVLTRSIQLGA